jgi:hypothetical protein
MSTLTTVAAERTCIVAQEVFGQKAQRFSQAQQKQTRESESHATMATNVECMKGEDRCESVARRRLNTRLQAIFNHTMHAHAHTDVAPAAACQYTYGCERH